MIPFTKHTRLWQEIYLSVPKLSALCYAHAAPRQPEQLPDYTLMYTHTSDV
jgi:hypothetical protein